ncbi:hypothetical protein CA233_10760 [Sphingomonas sp. ABOLD]|uniref:Glucosyltransferase GtrII-like protein n=1 Tax=Sphingomonas trueperi TaxID=53317 RepID=A0A7X5XV85_9SPHN|nr:MULTISPECIES: hypothetical protein [Sphingomonas]NJB95964.1 hypothetical protein [Sphingomonas trueperi]RSV42006.1 hypothetical protein CA234_08145 [Sphingomonas sp. ABOLE]RSV47796.1 hypothetical protein CA233_10760 [Sphingomonas sp. ABOLD]
MDNGVSLRWWQTRWFVLFATLVATVPLLWPDIPPLVDLPGHMGRYRVQLVYDEVPWLHEWYDFRWQLMGNLGVDLLVFPMSKIFGLELGVKLIVITIPAMTVAGFLMIAREVHGRIPATALFALPLAYAFPFHFGFVNFALSLGMAMLAFGWWLRLARLGKFQFRSMVFVPLSVIIWITHTFGWGVLGVLAFSAELVRQHDLRRNRALPWYKDLKDGWIAPLFFAGLQCLVLALPAVLMVIWRGGEHVSGQTFDWFNWRAKTLWVTQVFRDRWQLFDLASVGVIFLLMLKAVRDPNLQYSRNLGLSALLLLLVYLLLPRVVFGSAYADMRMVPFLIAIAILAIRPKPGLSMRGATLVAVLGLAFFLARIGATTASFYLYDKAYDRELKALDHVPIGARLVSFVGETCYNEWAMTRLQHVPGLALERRLAYTNDQWSMPGGQLMTVHYRAAKRFAHDPSELVTNVQCPREWWRPIARSLALFPRDAFDYVWLIRPPAYDKRYEQGLIPVWRDGPSVLYRVDHDVPGPGLNPGDLPIPRPEAVLIREAEAAGELPGNGTAPPS